MSTLFSIPRKAPAAQHAPRRSQKTVPDKPGAAGSARYVGGQENALAWCLARVLSGEQPDWNPLVLCGITGTGKSLLLDLFSKEFAATFPKSRVTVLTGADYARAYADACDTDSVGEFRQRLGRAQLLAIDDLHRLAGKEEAQQELVHLLDALTRRGSLIVVTMRESPLDAPLLPLLQSRLSVGLVVPLVPPGEEARREILADLAAQQQVALPPAVRERLADQSALPGRSLVSVPQLRHAVIELAQRARKQNTEIDPAWLDGLSSAERPDARSVMKQVAAAVGRRFQQSVADLRGETRRQSVARPRSLAMYLCRQLTAASFAEIGGYFGDRDHTTVMYSCRKTAKEIAESPSLARLAGDLAAGLAVGDSRG